MNELMSIPADAVEVGSSWAKNWDDSFGALKAKDGTIYIVRHSDGERSGAIFIISPEGLVQDNFSPPSGNGDASQ